MRRVRSEYDVPPSKTIDAFVVAAPAHAAMLDERVRAHRRGSRGRRSPSSSRAPSGAAANVILPGGTELIVPLEGLIDVEKECARLRTELAGLEKQLASLEARLENPGFVERAPAHVVEAERAKATEWRARRELLRTRIEGLCGAPDRRFVLVAACASAGPPPGGPEDQRPAAARARHAGHERGERDATRTRRSTSTRQINDRGTGEQDVDSYFLVSPSDGRAARAAGTGRASTCARGMASGRTRRTRSRCCPG